MERRKFIRNSCIACVTGIALSELLTGCSATSIISAPISGSDLVVPLSDFQFTKNKQVHYKKYIVVQNEQLQFPICIYRLSEKNYAALYMRCTHQGATLQVFGDKLQCPAHGSEFNSTGVVSNAPATENLRTFPISITDNHLKISLV